MNALNVTDRDFDREVLDSDTPVLVDVWAPWCAPCRTVGPVVEQLADEYSGRVKVAKVDIDANGETAERLDVDAVPTLLFFKGGRVVERLIGVRPKAEIAAILDALLE